MSLNKIAVIGAGMMGAEIALSFSREGLPVILLDKNKELTGRAIERLDSLLSRQVSKNRITEEEKNKALSHITESESYEDLRDCDLVIEAVVEIFDVKQEVFKKLDEVCKESTILASNTSSISITKLASSVSEERSERFVGMHFNSPASVMKLVEVIPGLATREETAEAVTELLKKIGKEPVRVKDVVGFALNRMFHVFYLEACRLVEEGVCTPEDIDTVCVHGLGHPIGIMRLLDITGHDLNLQVDEILFDAYGERFRPSPQIQRLVEAGRLGRKTGWGFYKYDK